MEVGTYSIATLVGGTKPPSPTSIKHLVQPRASKRAISLGSTQVLLQLRGDGSDVRIRLRAGRPWCLVRAARNAVPSQGGHERRSGLFPAMSSLPPIAQM